MRTDKLNAEFKRYIAEILTRKVKDPRITEMFTIVQVDCDNDLSYAKVYVSIFSTNPEKGAATFAAIKENARLLQNCDAICPAGSRKMARSFMVCMLDWGA